MDSSISIPLLAWGLLAAGFLLALLGTFLPGLPGALFVVLALLAHKWLLPEIYPWWSVFLVIGLALLSWLSDVLATTLGAKWGGASKWGMLGALVGGLLCLPFGLPGLILGPFIGAVVGDLVAHKKEWQALFKAGTGAAFGVLLALFLRLGLLLAMAALLFGLALWKLAATL